MLDEKQFRRASCDPDTSVPITMGDGRIWHLPRIWVKLRPTFSGGKATGTRLYSSAGSEFDVLRQAVEEDHSEAADGFLIAVMNLAAYMLGVNYELTDEQLEEVLAVPAGDDSADATNWIRSVIDLANGRSDPKGPSSPGSGPPSS